MTPNTLCMAPPALATSGKAICAWEAPMAPRTMARKTCTAKDEIRSLQPAKA